MAMFGAGAASAQYNPSQLSGQDKMMLLGAMLHDTGNSLRGGDSDSVLAMRNFLAQRQMYQNSLGMIRGLIGGQAQYQAGPDPSVSAPSIADAANAGGAPAPTSTDDLSGALAQSAASAAPPPAVAPAQPYVYQAPQRVVGTGPLTSIADPRAAQLALTGPMVGIDPKPFIDVLKANQPSVKLGPDGTPYDERSAASLSQHFANRSAINGQVIDLNDPKNTNRAIPQAPVPGANPVYDNRGNVVDWTMPGGAVRSIGAAEAAKTGAQEAAKLPYVGPAAYAAARGAFGGGVSAVPLPDGSSQLMPGDQFLAAAGAGGGVPGAAPAGGVPQIGRAPAAAGGPGLGRTQSSAEKALADARAATQGKNETDIAGARSAMQQVDDQTNMIAQNLHDMLGETQDPNTGKWVKTKPSMVTDFSTGSGTDLIEHVPFLNQGAKDLQAKIEAVRNGTAFTSIQAIKNALAASGDGGSGSVRMTDQTARMLGEINGSLNQDQSGPQFEATVRRHLAQLDALNAARHDMFESQYRGVRPTTPGQTQPTASYDKPAASAGPPSRAALMQEARRRGLIQ